MTDPEFKQVNREVRDAFIHGMLAGVVIGAFFIGMIQYFAR